MAKPLFESIQGALTNERARAADIELLIARVTAERDVLSGIVEQATADSVNFALSEVDREEAATKAEKSRRDATALASALEQLEAKLAVKRDSEATKARESEREAILAERDVLATHARERLPAVADELVAILAAIKANDERMKAAGVYEASAEAVAMGVAGTFRIGPSPVRRFSEMKIPDFANPCHLAWPPPNIGGLALAMAAPDYGAAREKSKRAQEREMARWKPYRLIPGMAHQSGFAIDIMAKAHVDEPTPAKITIYNPRQAPEDRVVTETFIITAEQAERLRGLGYTVELIEQEAV